MEKKVALCTVSSAGFLPGTKMLYHSFREHNPWFKGDFIIITDEPEAISQAFGNFTGIVLREPGKTLMTNIDALCREIPKLTSRQKRFFSLEAFHLREYDCVIFMDSDMLVVGDFAGVIHSPGPLAACSDMPVRNQRMVRDRKTFRRTTPEKTEDGQAVLRKTFNAGMMIIQPVRIPDHCYPSLVNMVHPDLFRHIHTHNTDQVVLNLWFDGQATILPSTYNMIVSKWLLYRESHQTPASALRALHFTGSPKPWETDALTFAADQDPAIQALYLHWQQAREALHPE